MSSYSSSKKVTILYGESPRSSNQSISSTSSSSYGSPRTSSTNMSSYSTYGGGAQYSGCAQYSGYGGSSSSNTSVTSGGAYRTGGEPVVRTLIRDPKVGGYGYVTTERTNTATKQKVVVHNLRMGSYDDGNRR